MSFEVMVFVAGPFSKSRIERAQLRQDCRKAASR